MFVKSAFSIVCCAALIGAVYNHSIVVTADNTDDEMNAWFDMSKDVLLDLVENGSTGALTWYVSLQMMQDILNDNEYMIHSSQFDDLRCGYGHFFDVDNNYQSCMFPLDFDTNERFNRILLCHTSVGDIYVSIDITGGSDSSSYLSYYRVSGLGLEVSASYGTSSPPVTVTVEGDASGYFTNTSSWNRSFVWNNPWSSSYSIQLTQSARVETVYTTYTPYISGNYMQFGDLCGSYSEVDMSDLNIADIAITDLYTEAGLHDYLEFDWLPGFSSAFPDVDLPPLPSSEDPTEPTTLPVYQPVTDANGQPVTNVPGQDEWQYNFEVPSLPYLEIPDPPTMEIEVETKSANAAIVNAISDLLDSSGIVPLLVLVVVIGALIFVVG